MSDKEQFGAFIRRKREEKDLGLQEMAKKIVLAQRHEGNNAAKGMVTS